MILRITRGIVSRLRIYFLRLLGVNIKGHIKLGKVSIPANHSCITLGKGVALDDRVTLLSVEGENGESGSITIGQGTYLNRNCMVDASLSIIIGDKSAFGPNCYITDHDHGIDFNSPPLELPLISKPTVIGNNVWVGANSIILKGVTIGDYAVIGAGSIVTKDIPSKSLAFGSPAKVKNAN